MSTDNAPVPRFSVGQKVKYYNGYGLYISECTITGRDYRTGRPVYYITPTDTPWFAVGEEQLEEL